MPDILRLVVSELGEPPPRGSPDRARYHDRALALAVAGSLPLSAVADALGQPETDVWRDALAAEQRRDNLRRETLDAVTAALGPAPTAVLATPGWRPLSGTDVDLLAVDVSDLADRLERAGFLPVPAHDEAQRRVLVRCAGGRAVDLVDLEAVSPDELEPAGPGSSAGPGERWGRLTREAAVRRFRRRLAERGQVRLVDRADAEALGWDDELTRAAPGTASGGTAPGTASRSSAPLPPRVRVRLTGPGARQEAERLAESLRVAALDVVVARSPAALPRPLARHLRDRAVLLASGRLPLPGAVTAEVPVGGLPDSDALHLLRRALIAGRRAR